jgi:hypothetical protein
MINERKLWIKATAAQLLGRGISDSLLPKHLAEKAKVLWVAQDYQGALLKQEVESIKREPYGSPLRIKIRMARRAILGLDVWLVNADKLRKECWPLPNDAEITQMCMLRFNFETEYLVASQHDRPM